MNNTRSVRRQANSDPSQERDIREFFKAKGYGVWIPLNQFPHLHEFNRAIHNLRQRENLNIENRCERVIRQDGRRGTNSFYRLNPGSWHELRGKPEKQIREGTRASRAASFEREFHVVQPQEQEYILPDLPLFAEVLR
jgi:hypothetical protein